MCQSPEKQKSDIRDRRRLELHNLGEGLAIGPALAGEAALGTFLVIGFTRNHVTEGIGIAAPIAFKRLPLWQFIALGALAGTPTILGTWISGS